MQYNHGWARVLGMGLGLLVLTGVCQAQEVAESSRWKNLRDKAMHRKLERAAQAGERISQPGDYALSMPYGGHTRLFRVYVPASYTSSVPAAMVLSLHGGGGHMDYQANDAFYGQISQSEQAGFVAVFPNGYSKLPGGKLATWNAGHCCGSARDEQVDDVGFIRALVARLRTQLAIDPQRIFANGMSNGGMMAYRLACDAADIFKAVASVAGTDNTVACAPSKPVSVLHIHARDDERVLFQGGAGQERAAVTDFVSVPASITQWVRLNQCSTTPTRVLALPGAYCDVYARCQGGVEVKLCVTETGGHSWPGGSKVRGGAAASTALSATETIGAFFATRHPQ